MNQNYKLKKLIGKVKHIKKIIKLNIQKKSENRQIKAISKS